MHFLYPSRNWFFLDYDKMLKNIGGYHNQYTIEIYKYWLKNHDTNFKRSFYNRFNSFINSQESIFSINHEKNC